MEHLQRTRLWTSCESAEQSTVASFITHGGVIILLHRNSASISLSANLEVIFVILETA